MLVLHFLKLSHLVSRNRSGDLQVQASGNGLVLFWRVGLRRLLMNLFALTHLAFLRHLIGIPLSTPDLELSELEGYGQQLSSRQIYGSFMQTDSKASFGVEFGRFLARSRRERSYSRAWIIEPHPAFEKGRLTGSDSPCCIAFSFASITNIRGLCNCQTLPVLLYRHRCPGKHCVEGAASFSVEEFLPD